MRKTFTIAFFCLSFLVLKVSAQQDPQFSQNMFTKLCVNPGFAGSNDAICGTLLYRNQWTGFGGEPKTMLLTADMPVEMLHGGVGLTVTMHMVRDRALADPVNQASIRGYAERYPNMRWILAHAARGFNVWHTIEGIESLRGLPNVWFDTSAVTEAGAFEAIADVMGHDRLMYGSDYPVSMMRGRCVGIGDSFHWLYADEMHLNEKHTALQPVLIGVESLRAVCLAARRCRWTDAQIEDVFASNALRVFQR